MASLLGGRLSGGLRQEQARWGTFKALRDRWALVSAATLLYWIANQALRPFVPLRLEELGASDLTIGTTVAAYSLSGLLLALPSGRLLDRVSLRRALALALMLTGASTAVLGLAPVISTIVVVLVANGIGAMVTWIALQALATNAGVGEARRQQLALFSFAWGVGLAVGPAFGALLYDRGGFLVLCATLAVVCVLAAGAALAGPDAPHAAAHAAHDLDSDADRDIAKREGFFRVLRRELDNPALMSVLLSSFVNLYVLSMRTSFYPVYLARAGVSVARIGVLLSIIGGASLVVRAVLPPLERAFGAIRILTWSTWIAITGIATTPILRSYWLLVAGALAVGIGLGANPPITINLVADHTPADQRGLAMGMRTVANRSAQVSQPLVFGGLSSSIGLGAAFPVSGGFLAALALWMSCRLRSLRGASAD